MTAMIAAKLAEPIVPVAFETDVFDSFDDPRLGRAEWDDFVADIGADLYVSYDWCRLWWKHYGRGRLRIYCFRHGNRIVGLAPMFVETIWLGPLAVRVAKRVGADAASTIFALPIAPEFAAEAYRHLIEDLITCRRCHALSFGPLPASDPTFASLRAVCQDLAPSIAVVRDKAIGVRTVFRLPHDFNAYLKGLSAGWRQNYRRRLKLLAAKYKPESGLVQADDAPSEFEVFLAQHRAQWEALGKLGHFRDWPGAEAFNRELVAELSRLGRLRLHRISSEGRPLAYQYTFAFAGTCYARLPARALDSDLHQIGIGVVGLVQLIELMIGEGVRRIELGSGHYDYKQKMGAEEEDVYSFVVASSRPGPSRRLQFFLKAADLLDLAYYRAWFLRLAPKLPLLRRPLWRLWIRTRL